MQANPSSALEAALCIWEHCALRKEGLRAAEGVGPYDRSGKTSMRRTVARRACSILRLKRKQTASRLSQCAVINAQALPREIRLQSFPSADIMSREQFHPYESKKEKTV